MASYDGDVTFNGVVLHVEGLTAVKKQKTRKSIIGKTLVETKILGLGTQQWELNIQGPVFGTTAANLSVNRADIEQLDDAGFHTYTDGIHNGTYVAVPGSITFEDSGKRGNLSYMFSMKLVEQ